MKKSLMKFWALLMVFCLVGCSTTTDHTDLDQEVSQDHDASQMTFALMPKTLNNPFFIAMVEKAQQRADELGVNLEVIAPAQESDIDQQVSMFESMLEKRVDGILIVPCGTKEIISSMEKANDMGIPVITVDTNSEGGDPLCFIGSDHYAGGAIAGKWIGENIKKGELALLTGTPGNLTHEDRLRGCREYLEKNYPDITIVGSALPTYSDRAQGMSQTENLLAAYPDLAAIYCVNDEIGLGAAEGLRNAGRIGEISIISFDGNPEASQAIIDGDISALVAQQPGKMGDLAVETMYRYITEGAVPESFLATDCEIVTKENATNYLKWH